MFVPETNLATIAFSLVKNHEGKLTTLQLIGMVRGVATGMVYLSAINFVHRVST